MVHITWTALLLFASPLTAQRIDPDWRLFAADSYEHFVAGAGIAVGARLVLPNARAWQRLAVVATIGAAFELGQSEATASRCHGRGYGFGFKDLLLDVAGAALVEWLW